MDFTGPFPIERVAKGAEPIRSTVLPALETAAGNVVA